MTGVTEFSLAAHEARAYALLFMARRESNQPQMTLTEAEQWWDAECDRLGLENRWPPT